MPNKESQAAQQALAQMREIVESPYRIAIPYAKARGWVVIPVESASHFNADDSRRIANASRRIGCSECLAVTTEQLAEENLCYRVQMTEADLLAFSQMCGHFNYLLFPDKQAFAILCTVRDYYLVAGPLEFAQEAAGGSVQTARSAFMEFARIESLSDTNRGNLQKIAADYAQCEGGSKGYQR